MKPAKHIITLLLVTATVSAFAQKKAKDIEPDYRFRDSVVVRVHPRYNQRGKVHRWLFGENYRKEWATAVKLPVIRISEIMGGLEPEKEGGGMQSKSLRLKDKDGKEWVIRSVEKTPDKLLPPTLRQTFVIDWLDDALSGQHPFSALVVPPMAKAAGVPHSHPVIGVIAEDKALGEYNAKFKNMVCLLEEREPIGDSDNSEKLLDKLMDDNDNHFDGDEFLKARMLDLLIGDWDRHEDQWRWADVKKGKGKMYLAVPRDRDQVFHLEEGVFPTIAALPYISPLLGDFSYDIPKVKYNLAKTRFLNPYPDFQMSHEHWMKVVNDFITTQTDAVFEEALKQLPGDTYKMGHDVLLAKLKSRRAALPDAMDRYYRFIYRIVDVRLSDKNEKVVITGQPDSSLLVQVNKINKEGEVKDTLMSMIYQPRYTDELRFYTSKGDDQVTVDNKTSPIHIRLIGDKGDKVYNIVNSESTLQVYARKDAKFEGQTNKAGKHLSNDSLNTRFLQTNLYNVWMPLATAGLNADDGVLIGAGVKYIKKDGFRKEPYTSSQQIMITHAFATDAFRVKYNGEWIKAIGNADILLQGYAQAPDNTANFFGLGNGTPINKNQPRYRRFYRTRFDNYQVDAALRWNVGKNSTFTAGPSFEFYHLDLKDNEGRFITNTSKIGSYDSAFVDKDKAHLGVTLNFNSNQRKGGVLPVGGYYFNLNVQGYDGLNSYSKAYLQIRPEFTFYQKITANGSVVISDRIGGGVSFGQPAFYQSMFLGGQGNLLGYLQYRFAGRHMAYNNLQARVKLFNVNSYIVPGQLGITGFYDAGRVWAPSEISDKIHQGVGGGVYFSPAGLTILQVLVGHSEEGWYPYVSMNFRI
ncbi:BamA/TamA family outer membrane protein [Mucilaginibacter sp. 21P]|uniref:outer membrane protein assembly factor n=1 Tax=Mucilaginibacter sp. 21P TaxID=2778902 RepID=UPI001C5A3434|nr:outer membrane protein assembly factor [Mucilaginibacter sp. 21P]QXV64979.1 BamA/TamA family outer membrane protein [Mucilaginibacter sp. 21P]